MAASTTLLQSEIMLKILNARGTFPLNAHFADRKTQVEMLELALLALHVYRGYVPVETNR